MLGNSEVIAFAAAADLDRAREFYQGTLGLTQIEQNPYACVFDARGTMLRVTAVAEVATPGYTVLGWRVGDIDQVIAGLTAKGVSFTRYKRIGPGRQWRLDNASRRPDCVVYRSGRQHAIAHPVRLTRPL